MDHFESPVRWLLAAPIYGCAYAAAVAVFWWMARRRAMTNETIARVMAAGLIGGLAGANIVQLIVTGVPGKTIEGGILGGWLAVIAAKRHLGVTKPTGDLFALAIPAGEAIGRIACFVGGCCYGKIASGLPWLVHDHDAWRHPAQLYLSAAAVLSFAILVFLERRARLYDGALLYVGGMLFCIDRFVVEFFRDGSPLSFGFTAAQIGCCLGFCFFAAKFGIELRASRFVASASA